MAESKKRPMKKQAATDSKKEKDPREKLTWKYWLIGLAGVILFTVLLLGAAQWLSQDDRMRFTEDEGMLVREDGVIFLKAPDVYAVRYTIGNDYGVTDKGNPIYKVGFQNTYGVLLEMDSDNYLTDGKGTLYYGSLATLPELASFRTDCVYVCNDAADEITVALTSLSNTNTPDATDFVEQFLAGARYVGDGLPQETYRLYLTSSTYEHLYYTMYLVRCDNNDFYVYTDEDRSSIKVSSRLFSTLIPTESSSSESAS